MKICPEEGLHAQKYRCKDCRCRIALNPNQSGSVSVKKGNPSFKVAKFCRPVKTKKKYLEVSKLDYVIILVIITVRFAIGMIFDQFLDLLFKIGIFLRNESAEVRDLKSTGSVHRPSMHRPRKVDP